MPESEWPKPVLPGSIAADDPEIKKDINVCCTIIKAESTVDKLLAHYSSWSKQKLLWHGFLVKSTLKSKSLKRKTATRMKKLESQHLSVEDMIQAEQAILRYSSGKYRF